MSTSPSPPSLFQFTDYKLFVRETLPFLPQKGRGAYTRIAEIAQTHKVTVSQIFSGDKHLTPEQAIRVAQFLNLSPRETRYFLLLVNYARAGNEDLRMIHREEMAALQKENGDLSRRLVRDQELSGEERAIFYSSWMYSAVRLIASIPGVQSPADIARRLNVSRPVVNRVLAFLLETGLCVEREGKLQMGPQRTYLEASSPLVARHHGNWRIKAMERHSDLDPARELSYTAPATLSEADAMKIRALLMDAIERVDGIIDPSPSEKLFCLNLDWFEVR